MDILSQSKSGSRTNFVISGGSAEQFASMVRSPIRKTEDGNLEVTAGNKREAASVRQFVEHSRYREQPDKPSHSGRYITSLETAERNGLNHGRAWVCKELDIQTKGANPSLEGEMICYVYN